MEIILASSSPWRKEIFEMLCVGFKVVPSYIDEVTNFTNPSDVVMDLSLRKGMSVAQNFESEAVIVSADTVVYFEGRILGKPKNIEDAINTLSMLQGNWHSVFTGVTIICKRMNSEQQVISFVQNTKVYIRSMDLPEIVSYVNTGEPMDKAGSYAIQGLGNFLVEKIEGDFYNVVGLPIVKVYQELKRLNIDIDVFSFNEKKVLNRSIRTN